MKFSVDLDISRAVKLTNAIAKQLPFAMAKALTLAAIQAQSDVVEAMTKVFDRPTPYTLHSTYVIPATKDRLESFVQLKDSAAKGTRAIKFLDLNRDELIRTPLRASYTGMKYLWLPRTVLESGFLVSMPKIKTHHWSGVTLSMKNMCGVVPGARYGWPKNILHWKGIQESILDLCATVPIHFVIADGIVAMEGNGPLNGTARPLGKIVLADDPVAADASCARLMGFEPDRIVHLREGSRFLGNASPRLIEQVGETVIAPSTPFEVVPDFRYLHATGVWL